MVRARPLYGLGYGFESRHSNFDFVAQLVEHRTFNAGVMGSNPIGITKCLYRIVAIAADCKSATFRFRWFESICRHNFSLSAAVAQQTVNLLVLSSNLRGRAIVGVAQLVRALA